ncbi:uncharacterized protein LOC124812732 isoform X2 [Hydra vulgaris]|nr:uncharacterized protein LOC124812732 isoform X2 [Hydra vulgaris]XP_047135640.1 uncharacterized protein LOC124812732 isoform X2 [Hydra vulgaris]XP_047135641.1 uncharacterized protein LOC124812732 isoform X2 [Hydra vulgaris]XP_047135642.1 uncharacterized protein LOC124812732 isoform X2 [Hydra vulgaris]
MTSSSGYWMNLLRDNNNDTSTNDAESTGDVSQVPISRKGVKKGTKRGKYEKSTPTVRRRVIAAAENGDDWISVAVANGVNQSTAYAWVKKGTWIQKHRDGRVQQRVKIEAHHEEALIHMLEENPQLTLKEMTAKLLADFAVNVASQTIAEDLNSRMLFSLKQIHLQPDAANSLTNKLLRREFLEKLMQATGIGKFIAYVDKSNVNLYIRRTHGRAKVGNRAVVRLPSSKGANVHMIGALTQMGLMNFTCRRGNYKMAQCNDWLKQLLQGIVAQGIPSTNIVVVIDNAPCHARANEAVMEFQGATILRLAPYSPILNPIEAAWSVIKSELKKREAATIQQVIAGNHNGLIQSEWRLQYVEDLIDEARLKITPLMCLQFVNHVQTFYADIIALKNMLPGQ